MIDIPESRGKAVIVGNRATEILARLQVHLAAAASVFERIKAKRALCYTENSAPDIRWESPLDACEQANSKRKLAVVVIDGSRLALVENPKSRGISKWKQN